MSTTQPEYIIIPDETQMIIDRNVNNVDVSKEIIDITEDDELQNQKTIEKIIKVKQTREFYFCKSNSGKKLTRYQKDAIKFITFYKSILLYFKVGSGKTTASCCAANNVLLQQLDKINKVLIIAPLSTHKEWLNTMREWGTEEVLNNHEIITYSNFARNIDPISINRTFIIFDEAHNLRNDNGVSSQKALNLRMNNNRMLLLSGTPVTNQPNDFGVIAKLLDKEKYVFSTEKKQFDLRFGKDGLGSGVEKSNNSDDDNSDDDEISLNSSHDVLKEIVSCRVLYYAPDLENDEDYPVVKYSKRTIPMVKEQNEFYGKLFAKLEKNVQRMMEDPTFVVPTSSRFNAFLLKARQYSNAITKKDNTLIHPKLDAIVDKAIKFTKRGRKVFIYTSFLSFGVEILEKLFQENGQNYNKITGKSTDDERYEAITQYNSGATRILIGTGAIKEGVTLKGTDYCFIVEPSWLPGETSQIVGRVARKGSHKGFERNLVKVYEFYCVGDDVENPNMYADVWVKQVSDEKKIVNERFMRQIVDWSLDKSNCITK